MIKLELRMQKSINLRKRLLNWECKKR
jgi:hypothetical protein